MEIVPTLLLGVVPKGIDSRKAKLPHRPRRPGGHWISLFYRDAGCKISRGHWNLSYSIFQKSLKVEMPKSLSLGIKSSGFMGPNPKSNSCGSILAMLPPTLRSVIGPIVRRSAAIDA